MNLRGLDLSGTWSPEELRELVQILAPLPRQWVEGNPGLKSIIRRSVLTNAPPEAPGHSKYEPAFDAIVVFDKGVYHGEEIDHEQFRRSIYHELAHSLIESDPGLLERWQAETGNDGVVDEYAETGPEEDFADTLSEFLIHRTETEQRVPTKAAFLQQLIREARQQEKTAMAFLDGFADEMIKTARGGLLGLIRRGAKSGVKKGVKSRAGRRAAAGRIPGKMSVGKGIMLGAGAAAAGGIAGSARGKKTGYEEGTGDVMEVAQRARLLGRREGVLAYHQALMQQRQAGG